MDLPASIQASLTDGALTMGHARALIGARDSERLAEQVIAQGLSVRETERLASAAKPATRTAARPAGRDTDIAALEHQLGDLLGLAVRIKHGPKGGTLSLNYSTLDQLDMVCQRLTGDQL